MASMRLPPVIDRILRLVVCSIGVVVLGFVLMFGAFVISRWWMVTTRVDQDGGPAPSWLPAEVTDVHVRGTKPSAWFSGRVPQPAIEAWAIQRGIPLKERRHGTVTLIDYGKVPLDWTSFSFHHDESIQTHLEDADEIIWERREGDGGGITLHYVPSRQAFHENRALW